MADVSDISKEYRVFAEQAKIGAGFVGLWAAPGMPIMAVRKTEGDVINFPSENLARIAAVEAMLDALNSPRRDASHFDKPKRYTKMTSAEFAVELRRSNMDPRDFADLVGASQKRVLAWLDGSEDVPHQVRLILYAMNRHIALAAQLREVTASVTTDRYERK